MSPSETCDFSYHFLFLEISNMEALEEGRVSWMPCGRGSGPWDLTATLRTTLGDPVVFRYGIETVQSQQQPYGDLEASHCHRWGGG